MGAAPCGEVGQAPSPSFPGLPGCSRAEVWYPHGGFYPDPKGWRSNLVLAFGCAHGAERARVAWAGRGDVRVRGARAHGGAFPCSTGKRLLSKGHAAGVTSGRAGPLAFGCGWHGGKVGMRDGHAGCSVHGGWGEGGGGGLAWGLCCVGYGTLGAGVWHAAGVATEGQLERASMRASYPSADLTALLPHNRQPPKPQCRRLDLRPRRQLCD
jgi:hypothetical protein